jgi:hypothetical protein
MHPSWMLYGAGCRLVSLNIRTFAFLLSVGKPVVWQALCARAGLSPLCSTYPVVSHVIFHTDL